MSSLATIYQSIEILSKEKGIDPKIVLDAVKDAMLVAARKHFHTDENLAAELDEATGSIQIYGVKTVVETVEDPKTQISVADAQNYGPDVVVGSEIRFPKPTDVLGRISAQTAKQVILQKVREAERENVYSEFSSRVYDSTDIAASRVEITVQTQSLDVLPIGADRRDGPRVEEEMREKVLHVDRWPTITFRSRSVTPIEDRIRVTGDLTLAGQTHPVTADMKVQAGQRALVATGAFSIKQTDWGIEPYSGALGTIRVADEVTFELQVVGVPVGR